MVTGISQKTLGTLLTILNKPDAKIGTLSIPTETPLDHSDPEEAVVFAENIIRFFANLYTEYGKWQPLYKEY